MTESTPAARRPYSLREPQARTTRWLALSISAALVASPALAQEEESVELDTLRVEDRTIDTNPHAEQGAPYKARTSGDTRRQTQIADTPATISIITSVESAATAFMGELLGERGLAFNLIHALPMYYRAL